MIAPAEACHYVQQELPEISTELPLAGNMYQALHAIREHACRNALDHNYSSLQKCLSLAAALYERGSAPVKNGVENVFVYSFSRLLELANEDKLQIKALIPASLLALYMNQVLHRGY